MTWRYYVHNFTDIVLLDRRVSSPVYVFLSLSPLSVSVCYYYQKLDSEQEQEIVDLQCPCKIPPDLELLLSKSLHYG
jgi:hypothetical protein